MLPPIISTTPNAAIVCAKPSTAAVRKAGRAKGRATVKKAYDGDARRVAATSSGRSPMVVKALQIGYTTTGSALKTDATTSPAKVNASVRSPQRGEQAARAGRAEQGQQIEAEHRLRQQ